MGQLLNIKKLEAGGNAFTVWEKLNEIVDALNRLKVTIIPDTLATSIITPGNITLDFHSDTPPKSPATSSQLGGGDAAGSA